MSNRITSDLSVSDAVSLYHRLRLRGQNSLLARLSVEARCGNLSPDQRKRVRQLLHEREMNLSY